MAGALLNWRVRLNGIRTVCFGDRLGARMLSSSQRNKKLPKTALNYLRLRRLKKAEVCSLLILIGRPIQRIPIM